MWCERPAAAGATRGVRSGPSVNWGCFACKDGATLHGRYVSGFRHGEWVLHSPGGGTLERRRWKDDRKSGQWRGWYANGRPRYSAMHDADGNLSGPATSWHPQGDILKQGTWLKGERHGIWTRRKVGGKVASRTVYVAGKATRLSEYSGAEVRHTEFDDKGLKRRSWSEREGKKHGVESTWHSGSDKLARRATWADGVAQGKWAFFNAEGEPLSAGPVAKGGRVCGWEYFDSSGRAGSLRATYARVVAERAREAGSGLVVDTCSWTLSDLMPLATGDDAAATLAVAGWVTETAVEARVPPQLDGRVPDIGARLAACSGLLERAEVAMKDEKWPLAALLYVAVLLEIDRALGRSILGSERPASVVPKAPVVSPPDAAEAQKYREVAAMLLPAAKNLLWLRGKGDKVERKKSRVVLGRAGVTRFSIRKMLKKGR